jgi:uncharacterized protein (DUF924 family)
MRNEYTKIIHFWFQELSPQQWWVKSDELDNLIKNRYGDLHKRAIAGELSSWRNTALGRLAEIRKKRVICPRCNGISVNSRNA